MARANAAGHFRKIIGRMQVSRGFFPIALVDEVVPIGDLVVDRAAGVAIGHAAIHAARGLVARLLFRQRQDEFAPMRDALLHRRVATVPPIDFEEAGDFAHLG